MEKIIFEKFANTPETEINISKLILELTKLKYTDDQIAYITLGLENLLTKNLKFEGKHIYE